MEKDGFFAGSANPNNFNWQEMNNNNNNSSTGSGSGSASASASASAGVDQLAATSSSNCFLNLNWDQSPAAAAAAAAADQTANFESALSSLVSSPTSSSAPIPNDSVVIRELIGRLGSICNPNDNPNSNSNSPPGSQYHSTNTSCYTTPLNSPPKLNLSIMMDHRGQLLPGGIPPQHYHSVPFAADPGFVERAARYSAFGTGAGAGAGPRSFTNPQLGPGGVAEPRKLSRMSSSQSLKAAAAAAAAAASNSMPPNQMTGQLENDAMMRTMMMTMMRSGASPSAGGPEESSASDHRMAASGSEGNVRKRKAKAKDAPAPPPPPPPKMADEENSNAKRSRSAEEGGADTGMPQKVEKNGEPAQKQSKDKLDKEKENNAKPAEPPKQDYIHVRARRGQATDSHSLAERVRREKISERMKFLQDLVPGCNKVTGKAVMLDEIINYVQSLQRQVEFLSMKLATVNPRLEFNADNLLPKDTQQPAPGLLPSSHLSFPLDQATSTAFSYSKQPQGQGLPPHPTLQSFLTNGGLESQCPVNPLDAGLHRSLSMHLPPLDGGFMDVASQLGAFWEDDLQSVVQMGFGQQNQLESISSSHNLQGR